MTLRPRIVDAIFGTLEFIAAGYDFIRGIQKRLRRDTEPSMPLPHKDAERIAEFGRHAGHETDRLPKPPRVPRDLR